MLLFEIPPQLIETLTRVHTFVESRSVPCYLVGGFLRDQLLGRTPTYLNVDLTIPHDATQTAQSLAGQLGGAFVPLDEQTDSARVVVTHDGLRMELDLGKFRGPSLEEDLRRRDFTVNAMAIALSDWLRDPHRPHPLIDPCQGSVALSRKHLIPCFPETFTDDPLRILRAFRFVAQLEFVMETSMEPLMAQASAELVRVSGERIRDELLAICETDRAAPAIHGLNRLGALDVIIPELEAGRGVEQGDFHHLDVLGHQLETVVQTDRFLADFAEFSAPLREPLAAYCAEQLVERRSRKGLIKLAGLLHDVGKPARRTVETDGEIWFIGHEETGAQMVEAITTRLRLSNREATMVYQLVRHHLRPGFLSREPQLTRRAIYRFFKELEENGPGCLLTWWADRMATRGPKSRLDQLDQQRGRLEELLHAYFFKADEVVKPPRLMSGNDLMRAFRLHPGPLIGELLEAIEEAQAEGRIRTADEALALAREQLKAAGKE